MAAVLSSVPSLDLPPVAAERREGRNAIGEVLGSPGGAIGAVVVVGLLVLAVFGPEIAPYSATAINPLNTLQGPSLHHLLGTDQLGRDILSRLILGTRLELSVAVPSVGGAVCLGLLLGLVGAYVGGVVDNLVVLLMDSVQAFPAVVLALGLLAIIGPSTRNLILVIGLAFTPNYARVSRALVYSVKQEQFVLAERSLGARGERIMLRHIVPNIVAPLLILMAMDMPSAITTEAGLSFLGLGVPPPNPSWGAILADGFNYIQQSPWAVIWTSVTLAVTTVGFMLLGEALRDVFDPRVRGVGTWRA